MKELINSLKNIYNRLDKQTGGFFSLMVDTVTNFNNAQAPQAAAALAYFALFSLFPLLVLIIVVGSFVLERDVVQQQVSQAVAENLPGAQNLIQQNIEQVLNLRGPVSIVGIVGLLWAASGMFNMLTFNINAAWSEADVHNFLERRLVALSIVGIVGLLWAASGMFNMLILNINAAWSEADVRNFLERRLVALSIVGVLFVLLLLSVLSTFTSNLLAQFNVPLGDNIDIYQTGLWRIWSNVVPLLLRLALFWGLYRWIPTVQVGSMAAFWGAVVAATGWELATNAFSFYLSSGLANYDLVYGSLGTIVGLMFWIYLGSLVTLFGAHLTAAITRRVSPSV